LGGGRLSWQPHHSSRRPVFRARRSIQTGAPVAVEDIANDPEFRYADVLREHSIVSVLNVPIFVEGTHWGVLEVDTVEKTTFAEFEVHSLAIFANILGMSLAKDAARNAAAKEFKIFSPLPGTFGALLRAFRGLASDANGARR
jgi:GAF domain-containing protein